jgi:hypothetical protein
MNIEFNLRKIEVGHNNLGSNYTPDEQMMSRIAKFYKRNGLFPTEPPDPTLAEKYLIQPLVASYSITWKLDASHDTTDKFALRGRLNAVAGNVSSISAAITSIVSPGPTPVSPPSSITDPTFVDGSDMGDLIILVPNAYSTYNMTIKITANKPNMMIIGSGVYSTNTV